MFRFTLVLLCVACGPEAADDIDFDEDTSATQTTGGSPTSASTPTPSPTETSLTTPATGPTTPPSPSTTSTTSPHERACSEITEAEVEAWVGSGPKVPPGYWFEEYPFGAIPELGEGCATDASDTLRAAAGLYEVTGATSSAREYHEAEAIDHAWTVLFRQFNCDWFDGRAFAPGMASDGELRWLASMVWFFQFHNLYSAAVMGSHSERDGDTTELEVCHVWVSFGDFGIEDHYYLDATPWTLDHTTGQVTTGETVGVMDFWRP